MLVYSQVPKRHRIRGRQAQVNWVVIEKRLSIAITRKELKFADSLWRRRYSLWRKQACGYQVGGRNSDSKTHLSWFICFANDVCRKLFNHLKIKNPRSKYGILTDVARFNDCVSPCTDSLLALVLLFAIYPSNTTAVFEKQGETLKNLNEYLIKFNNQYDLADEASENSLTLHYNRNPAVNESRIGNINTILIDLRYGFSSGNTNSIIIASNRDNY